MTDAEKLARAVLLFHDGEVWTSAKRQEWLELTGAHDATTRTFCDLARRVKPSA